MFNLILLLLIIESNFTGTELKREFRMIEKLFNEDTSFSKDNNIEDFDDYEPMDTKRISITKCNEYKAEASKFKRPMGRIGRTLLVFNGKEANIKDFPHMGALGWKSKSADEWIFLCSSSLISLNYILTAAHCTTVSRNNQNVAHNRPQIVRFGVTNIRIHSKYDVNLVEFYEHPYFQSPKQYFDIALIKLQHPVFINKRVQPACLWVGNDLNMADTAVTGWGRVRNDVMESSPILEVAPVDIMRYEDCKPLLFSNRNFNGLADHQICAVNLSSGAGSCQGDSGAPLQMKLESHSYVIGVTSFGYGCGHKLPGVYTFVPKFLDWIETIVWG